MIQAARCYLDGAASITELHGAIAACAQATKAFSAHPAITALAQEWQGMVERCWDEWGLAAHPITEAEFREWLQHQLDCETANHRSKA